METDSQHTVSKKKWTVTKKEIILSIIVPVVGAIITIFFSLYDPPEPENKTVLKNRSGGENQIAVLQLPPVQSFVKYLGYIQKKDSVQMWEQSSEFRKNKYNNNRFDMYYDYLLTNNYEVQYIIPKGESNSYSENGPEYGVNREFSFYALLRFEDNVSIEGEVDKLKTLHKTELQQICDSAYFEMLFEQVLDEVYRFIDRRFVVDSAEYVKNELRKYMMNMTLKNYITQDWRFPINFAREQQLHPKKEGSVGGIATNVNQAHTILCNIVMTEEGGEWKLSKFATVALSRWGE